ncbi:MAG: methylmalonyl-CoA epimerase [Anaerolineales bacterium]|nr:methylmalonyl-CoA epimerase [Anaerolineales bacterium]MCB8950567.1 methylmalonyl-CoA epimerase [Ardenticatenales bacterium]
MTIIGINHVAIVVPDLEAGQRFWVDALGLSLDHVAHVPEEGVDVAFLPAGNTEIELLQPLDENNGVGKFLRKRGPGIHHICLEVAHIEETMSILRDKGVRLLNETPRTNPDGRKYAFVHPKSTGGVLVELYQIPHTPDLHEDDQKPGGYED